MSKKVFALTWHIDGASEIIHIFSDPDEAKKRAKVRCPDLGQWVEHNAHGLYWEANYSFLNPGAYRAIEGSYSVAEVELD